MVAYSDRCPECGAEMLPRTGTIAIRDRVAGTIQVQGEAISCTSCAYEVVPIGVLDQVAEIARQRRTR